MRIGDRPGCGLGYRVSMRHRTWATDVTTIFGRTLAALREAAGLTQDGLGELVAMDRTTIARLEIGRTTLSIPVQAAVEQVLIARRILRQHGDLAVLSDRVVDRLLAQSVVVCLDRPGEEMAVVPSRVVNRAAEAVIDGWTAGLRGVGDGVEGQLGRAAAAMVDGPRLVLAGSRLRTARARPEEIAQRRPHPPAA